MRPLDPFARRLPSRNHRRLTLLAGSLVATWIGVARGQSQTATAGDAPVLLRSAASLSLGNRPAAPAEPTADLRIARQLSPATETETPAPALADSSEPALLRAAPALARRPAGRQAAGETAGGRLRLAPQLAAAPAPVEPQLRLYPSAPAAFTAVRSAQAEEAPAGDADADNERPVPAVNVSASAPGAAPALPDLESVGWAIPPIRWGGNTGSTYVYNSNFEGNHSFTNTQIFSGRAASFIYAPWLAQVTANAGLSTTGATNTSGAGTNKADSTAISYGGNANLFPLSRFPFSAYLESSDSRAKAVSAGSSETSATTQYNSLRVGARQFYRPETGNASYNGNADHSVVSSSGISSIVNAFQAGYSNSIQDHNFAASTRFSSTSGDIGGQASSLFGANGSHNWQIPEEGLTINNSVNFSRNDLKTLATTGTGLTTNNSQVMQASSSFSWLPDEDLPLTIAGGVGLLNTTTTTEAQDTSLFNLNSYVSASYRITNNLMTSGGVTVATTNATRSGTLTATTPTVSEAPTRLTTTSQFASISYTGNPLTFETFSYNWGVGGNLSNQTNSLGGASRQLGSSGQHSVNKNIVLSDTSVLGLNATQSVGINAASGATGGGNQNTQLNHSAGAVWRVNLGQVSVASLSFNATDSYSTGTYSNHLRSFSGSGNFQTQFSARSSLGASASFSASQQLSTPLAYTTTTTFGTTTTTPPPTSWSGNGHVFYSHRSPFDIANLLYTASFTANANQTNLRLVTGDANALSWQIAKVFSNQVTYRLGRLAFQATASVALMGDGKKNATLFGSVNRDIGDF